MPVRKVAAVKGHGKWVLAWHRHSCLCGFSLLGGHEDKILVEQFGIGELLWHRHSCLCGFSLLGGHEEKILVEQFGIGELLSGMGGGLRRTARNGCATKTGAEFRMSSSRVVGGYCRRFLGHSHSWLCAASHH